MAVLAVSDEPTKPYSVNQGLGDARQHPTRDVHYAYSIR